MTTENRTQVQRHSSPTLDVAKQIILAAILSGEISPSVGEPDMEALWAYELAQNLAALDAKAKPQSPEVAQLELTAQRLSKELHRSNRAIRDLFTAIARNRACIDSTFWAELGQLARALGYRDARAAVEGEAR